MEIITAEAQRGERMKIRRPINFAVGVFCGICLVINIVKDRDAFTLCLNAIITVGNIIAGLLD